MRPPDGTGEGLAMPKPYIEPTIEFWRMSRRRHLIPVEGTSMMPLLRQGDRVSVSWIQPDALRRGDIIAYWNTSRIVVHRLLRIARTTAGMALLECGDRGGPGRWIDTDQLLGRVESVQKKGRTIHLSGTRWQVLACLLVPLLRLENRLYSRSDTSSSQQVVGNSPGRARRLMIRVAALPRRSLLRIIGGKL
jgi:hypothetical protein